MIALVMAAALQSAALVLPGPAFEVSDLVSALEHYEPDSVSPEDCDLAFEQADVLNAPSLFIGAVYCFESGQNIRGASLLHFGQVRSSADMSFIEEITERNRGAADLWGLKFYQFGGSAEMADWADSETAAVMINDLENWAPRLPASYQPGWPLDTPYREGQYFEAMEESSQHRLDQLRTLARLGQNPRYMELSAEQNALMQANPNGFTAGTPDSERINAISEEMNALYAEAFPD